MLPCRDTAAARAPRAERWRVSQISACVLSSALVVQKHVEEGWCTFNNCMCALNSDKTARCTVDKTERCCYVTLDALVPLRYMFIMYFP